MVNTLIRGAIAAGLAALVVYLFRQIFERVIVFEYEKGLRYHKGRFTRLLDAGQYWIFKPTTKIVRIDIRPTQWILVGQEVLSQDAVGLKVSLAVNYQVIDPVIATHSVKDYFQALYLTVQVALREVIGSRPIDELLEQRGSFDEALFERCRNEVEKIGIKLLSVNVRDIMFPGDLKKVFAKVVQARKEGLAALERARGETAALRSLANAAKLMENNPTLLQLRMLQALGESAGNTLVLQLGGGEMPLPVGRPGLRREETKAAASVRPEPTESTEI